MSAMWRAGWTVWVMVAALWTCVAWAGEGEKAPGRKAQEARLIAVLKGPSAQAEKEGALRDLRIVGTEDSVPVLAGLLTDKALGGLARSAMEPMPYASAGAAFREALGKTAGAARLGIIHTLGTRRDQAAAGALAGLLKDADGETASAAAAALGNIGTAESARALTEFQAQAPREMKEALGEALLAAAERLAGENKNDQAGPLFEALQDASYPKHIRLGSFRGLVAARPEQAPARLLAALGGQDRGLANLASQILTELPADEKSSALYAENLPKLPPSGQMALVRALARRKDAAARGAVVQAAKGGGDRDVQLTAAGALATAGTAAEVPLLAGLLAGEDAETAATARTSLATMSGTGVNEAIAEAAGQAGPAARAQLIGLLGQRGAQACSGAVVKAVDDADAKVRSAALKALGQIGGKDELPAAMKVLKGKADGSERQAAEEAVLAIAARAGDEALAGVLAGMAGAAVETRVVLTQALGRIGTAKAMQAVQAALKDAEADVANEAVRVLAGWPTCEAAPLLLDLAKNAEKPNHKVLAARGYIRLAGLEKEEAAKAAMLVQGSQIVQRPDEKKLLLGAWATLRKSSSLPQVVRYLEDEAVRAEAADAAIKIAEEVGPADKAAVKAAMEQVLAACKDSSLRERAQQVLDSVK